MSRDSVYPLKSEILPVGLVITDASEALLITEWNRAAERIFGYSRSEAIGKSWYALIAAEPGQLAMRENVRRSIRPESSAGTRTQNRTKDGRTIWCEWFNTPLRDASGAPIGVIGMVQDITERLEAEERRRLWTVVLEQTAEGIMICDAEARILLVNSAFQQLTKYSEADVIGKTPRILRSGRHDDAFYARMWETIDQSGQWHGEIWNRRKDGELYVEWLSISAVRNEHGAITHYIAIFSDITQRKRTEERVAHLAHHDSLTDLPNRTLLSERLERALSDARSNGHKLALLFVGLDRFKNINDSIGHAAGDELLRVVAERLRGSVRTSDLVARVGGDEFAVMLPQIESARDPEVVAEKVLSVLQQPVTLCGHELAISASIGICISPDDAQVAGELIRNADAAMFHAKNAGRSAYRFYTRDMNARALETLATENALRTALSRNEFVLHYQPQVELATGELVGAEALIRWRRPGAGLLMPGRFIPVAEERGLIAAIDHWVLGDACRQLAAWTAAGIHAPRVAVNLSASEFHQPAFAQRVERVLSETGVPPDRIELELTESIIVRDAQATIGILRRLRDAGVVLSIDDFGTGYSSLNYLRRFPIHKIKMDQSFVREMLNDEGAAGIVRGIIALAKSLKLEVIAEGVETFEQREHLRAEGCDTAQGYFYSRALGVDDFAALVRGWRPADWAAPVTVAKSRRVEWQR